MQQESDGCEHTCVGHVLVYVDDIMALAKDDVRTSFFDVLQQEWKCSDVETVDKKRLGSALWILTQKVWGRCQSDGWPKKLYR